MTGADDCSADAVPIGLDTLESQVMAADLFVHTDNGEYFVAVVSLMPGLSEVELVEQGESFVTIRTN